MSNLNRDEIIFYFKSLHMTWVVLFTIQIALVGFVMWLFFGKSQETVAAMANPQLIWLLAIPLSTLAVTVYIFKKKLQVVKQGQTLEDRLAQFRKLFFICWALLLAAAIEATAVAVFSGEWLIAGVNVIIMVYFATIRTTPIKLPRQLQFTKADLVELQALYQKY